MTSGLHLASNLTLPLAAVTDATAIVGRRGSGKTHCGMIYFEEIVAANIPCVMLDPMGVAWGTRASADGKHEGLPVTILGGDHGDRSLSPTAGKVVADLVVDRPSWYVLDLTGQEFEEHGTQERFAYEFMSRLYAAKARRHDPLHFIVDEGQQFAPQAQRSQGGWVPKMLGAAERIARQGRLRGIGSTWITQRPASLNKNVLEQVEVFICFQITGVNDRDAVERWVSGYADKNMTKTFVDSLASLKQGEAWVSSPTLLGDFRKAKIRARSTYDASSTPKPGESKVMPTKLAEVDLDSLDAKMFETFGKSEADDPVRLRARIKELEQDRVVERPALTDEDRDMLVDIMQSFVGIEEVLKHDVDREFESVRKVVAERLDVLGDVWVRTQESLGSMTKQYGEVLSRLAHPIFDGLALPPVVDDQLSTHRLALKPPEGLSKAAMAMLVACARGARTLTQMALVAGYSRNGNYTKNSLYSLTGGGYVEQGDEGYVLTATGESLLSGGEIQSITTREVVDLWIDKSGKRALSKAAKQMLWVLGERNGSGITFNQLADAIGKSVAGNYTKNSLYSLTGLGLVQKDGKHYRLADEVLIFGGKRW